MAPRGGSVKRLRWSVVAVALGLLSGCTCDPTGAPPGARYRFTADGTGPVGEHLSVIRVGQLHSGIHFLVDSTSQRPDGQAARVIDLSRETYTSVVETPAGLFATGTSFEGTFPNPRLSVPAKVRVGMKWDVLSEKGEIETSSEVVSREENVTTLFGPRTVWTIRQLGSNGSVDRVYVEGFGNISGPPDIWPVDAQAVEEPTPKPVTLEELPLPDSLAFTQSAPWIDGVSLVRPDPGGPAMLLLAAGVDQGTYVLQAAPTGCARLEGGQISSLSPTAGRAFRRTHGLECPSAAYCVRVPGVGTQGAVCPATVLHGNGAMVTDDGTVTWIARKWDGRIVPASPTGFGPEDPTVKAGGAVYAVAPMEGVDGGGDALVLPKVDTGGVGLPVEFGDATTVTPSALRVFEHSLPFAKNARAPSYDEVIHFGADEQGRALLLLKDSEGMIFWSRLEGDRFSHPRAGGRIGGRLSVQAQRGGPDVLRITSDGSVDRLVFCDDELKLEHLADATLPKTNVGIGAFVDGDRLLIATLANGTPDAVGETASLHLYRTSPFSGGQVVRIPQALTITVRPLIGFTEISNAVCWRRTADPVDLSAWTMDEQPADFTLEVVPGDQCVVLGLDERAHGTGNTRERIAGVIPGVGRVFLKVRKVVGGEPLNAIDPNAAVAVLRDGTLVSPRRRYTRGGFDQGLPDRLGPTFVDPQAAKADWSGAGLWLATQRPDGGAALELRGATTTTVPVTGSALMDSSLWPSGVALSSGTFVFPDGGVDVPTPGLPGARCARTADGSECGYSVGTSGELFCRSAGGVMRALPKANGLGESCQKWIPRGDGTFLLSLNEHLSAFDPVAMTLTFEQDAYLMGYAVDVKGRGLVVKQASGGTKPSIHFASAGLPLALDVPDGVWTTGGNTVTGVKLLSTPDMTFLALTWTGTFGTAAPLVFRLPPVP